MALRNNKPVGVMLGDNWTAETVQTHVGVTDPLVFKHGLHKEFANWVFGVCGRSAMLGFVPASNEKAIKIDKHFGFKEEYRIKDGYKKGVDVIIFRLDWYDCPYYEAEKFRKVA